jgi:hypothetical protein
MTTQTTASHQVPGQTTFDLAAFGRAITERDASAQLAYYATDARVEIVDQDNPPSSPRVLAGQAAIGEWIEDLCARDMTHSIELQVAGPEAAAFTQNCRYPDGTRVLCCTVLQVSGGQISRQVAMQAWDG